MKLGSPQNVSRDSGDLSRTIQAILKDYRYGIDDEVFAIEVASYLRVLKGVTTDELFEAWEAHQGDPRRYDRNGHLLKPLAVKLRERIIYRRRMAEPFKELPPPDPVVERSAEEKARADAYMADAGFTTERRDLLKRFPACRTGDELSDAEKRSQGAHWSKGLADDDPRLVAMREGREAYKVTPKQAEQMRQALEGET